MTRKDWIHLVPAVLLAVGILVSTAVAVRTSDSGWLILAAPLLMALTIVGADALASRLRGESFVPSWISLLLGAAFLVACLIVAVGDSTQVVAMIPILGGGCAGGMYALGATGRRTACRRL